MTLSALVSVRDTSTLTCKTNCVVRKCLQQLRMRGMHNCFIICCVMPLTSATQTDHSTCAALCQLLSSDTALPDTAVCRLVLQLPADAAHNMSTDSC
jgi:hypothetical protein